MGLEFVTVSVAVLVFYIVIFGYVAKRHYDTKLIQISKDVEIERVRIEQRSDEFKELTRKFEDLERKFEHYQLSSRK